MRNDIPDAAGIAGIILATGFACLIIGEWPVWITKSYEETHD